jgi:hypothetical protein
LGTLTTASERTATIPEEGVRGPRSRPKRLRVLLAVAGALLAVFVAASAVLFVFPASDQPRHVDAILSLNGENEPAREALAVSLANRGYAPVLVFSQGHSHTTKCPKGVHARVICFEAVPDRTAGEVEYAASLAHRYGWKSVMIVPGRAQATRARMLLKRCYSGQIAVVTASVPLTHLPYEVAYEWGALAKALFIDPTC